MANIKKFNAYDLFLQRWSTTRLKQFSRDHLKKQLRSTSTKEDYIDLLAKGMKAEQKIDALRSYLLAGRVSMSAFQFTQQQKKVSGISHPPFKEATETPQIVLVGKEGELAPGMRHVVWAVLVGHNAYVDSELDFQVDDQAAVISSFFDTKSQILQVRANTMVANKIGKVWAEKYKVHPDSGMEKLGLNDVKDLEKFVDQLKGSITKCKGEKIKMNGFGVVSGEAHAGIEDLRGTDDYTHFVDSTRPTDYVFQFQFAGSRPVKIGVGFDSRSFVFRNIVDEATIRYIYKELKRYLKIK